MSLTAKQYACALITMHEQFRSNPYADPIRPSIITIGYGTTFIGDEPVTMQTPSLFKNEAVALVGKWIDHAIVALDPVIPHIIQSHELGAIISLAYNEGIKAIFTSTMAQHLSDANLIRAAVEFPQWCMSAGHFVHGLLERRLSEQYTFLSGEFIRDPGDDYTLLTV
jgi:GH24 family phage-related lysozyme (muramidase)